ncbi:Crp/Fnr family transcriptional regulator [Sphingobium boeckii]|uniref:Cyclic nucleotide-binding domain-containing protein n=1 Tax=Sphingobium boeckii TaxID=1082345 RepID=A0A7W9AHL9_9SPHN|nr:cyclic nucleotide-binding domain-containing protein [Sphingobium boeckii]MBB5685852.1 hypothetical protein [Sphingobium boeckii]
MEPAIHSGLTGTMLVNYIGMALMIAGLASGRLRTIRMGAAAAGLIWCLAALFVSGDWAAAALAAALAFIGGYQLVGVYAADGRAKLSEEEQALGAAMLPDLGKAQLRHLLEQGFWLTAKPGDVLTREGEAVPHLYYLASGGATVYSEMLPIARCETGSFVGEVTVLSGDPATGTVEVDEPSRLWCVPALKLRLYTDEHDEIRRAVETAFRRTLTAKLVASNRRLAGGG